MMRINFRSVISDDHVFRRAVFYVVILSALTLWLFRALVFLGVLKGVDVLGYYSADFREYYKAALMFVRGEDFYREGFFYPPPAVLFFVPPTFMSMEAAAVVFLASKLIILLAISLLIIKVLNAYGMRITYKEKINLISHTRSPC